MLRTGSVVKRFYTALKPLAAPTAGAVSGRACGLRYPYNKEALIEVSGTGENLTAVILAARCSKAKAA
jgi:hypothetical protein